MKSNIPFITFCIMLMIVSSITFNEFSLNEEAEDKWLLLGTWVMFILALGTLYKFNEGAGEFGNNLKLLSIGLFSISAIGYTIYQWEVLSEEDATECGYLIPHTNNFNSSDYYLYRVIYLVTLIVLVSILQFKIDENDFYIPTDFLKNNIHLFLFMIPFVLPLMTELFTYITNLLPGPKINPESLLSNFITGDSKKEDGVFLRSIMPILVYVILMGMAILSSGGFIGNDRGETAIYIILMFIIGFSFIMRTTFIQDCSLEKDVSESGEEICFLEKYGGIQSMFNVCLIIIIIYHIKKPTYKVLFFIIICLGSWALSTTYILNRKTS